MRLALPIALVALSLAACTASAPQEHLSTAVSPRLPGKVVWTDGHGAIPVAASGQPSCAPISEAEMALALAQTNATRAAAGQPPLVANAKLMRSAAAQACDMAGRGLMTHQGSASSGPMARARAAGYGARKIAENIAAGRFQLAGVLEQWSASPAHRANVTLNGVRDFGIGRAVAADGKTTFWAAVYAR